MTKQDQILALLRDKGTQGVTISELSDSYPNGIGCKQYNSRIKALREDGHNIVSIKDGLYMLFEELDPAMTVEEANAELKTLRSVWEIADSGHRKYIEERGKRMLEIIEKVGVLV
jgi:hypothetical protein